MNSSKEQNYVCVFYSPFEEYFVQIAFGEEQLTFKRRVMEVTQYSIARTYALGSEGELASKALDACENLILEKRRNLSENDLEFLDRLVEEIKKS